MTTSLYWNWLAYNTTDNPSNELAAVVVRNPSLVFFFDAEDFLLCNFDLWTFAALFFRRFVSPSELAFEVSVTVVLLVIELFNVHVVEFEFLPVVVSGLVVSSVSSAPVASAASVVSV